MSQHRVGSFKGYQQQHSSQSPSRYMSINEALRKTPERTSGYGRSRNQASIAYNNTSPSPAYGQQYKMPTNIHQTYQSPSRLRTSITLQNGGAQQPAEGSRDRAYTNLRNVPHAGPGSPVRIAVGAQTPTATLVDRKRSSTHVYLKEGQQVTQASPVIRELRNSQARNSGSPLRRTITRNNTAQDIAYGKQRVNDDNDEVVLDYQEYSEGRGLPRDGSRESLFSGNERKTLVLNHSNLQAPNVPKLFADQSMEVIPRVDPKRVTKVSTTPGLKQQKYHRMVMLGAQEVGKTCLFLRYIFNDQSKPMHIYKTPHKDGYIFTKTFEDYEQVVKYEMWDFLNPLEARQCLGLDVQKDQNAHYDAFSANKDYIIGSDVILLVFDIQNRNSFEHCLNICNQIKHHKTGKIIFVANKCDSEMRIDQDWCASMIKDYTDLYFQVCATNKFGTAQLFEEVDKIDIEFSHHPDDYHWQYLPQLRSLLTEKQEAITLQIAYLALRAEMKFYANIGEHDTYYVRSDINDTLAMNINKENQIVEIQEKIPVLRAKISGFMNMAANEAITHTAEFEYAQLKLMELDRISGKLDTNLKKIQKRNKCFMLIFLIMTIAFLFVTIRLIINLMWQPDMSYEINQRRMERHLMSYEIKMYTQTIQRIELHQQTLTQFDSDAKANQALLKQYTNAKISQLKPQISALDQSISTKINLMNKRLFQHKGVIDELAKLKTDVKLTLAYKFQDNLVDDTSIDRALYYYKFLVNTMASQSAQLKQSSSQLLDAANNYFALLKKKDAGAAKYMQDKHNTFNQELKIYMRTAMLDEKASAQFKQKFEVIKTPLVNARLYFKKRLQMLQSSTGLKRTQKQKEAQCLVAHHVHPTSVSNIVVKKIKHTPHHAGKTTTLMSTQPETQLSSVKTQKTLKTPAPLKEQTGLVLVSASTYSSIKACANDAVALDAQLQKRAAFVRTSMDYKNIQLRSLASWEHTIFKQYTDATCLEAYQMIKRDELIAHNLADYAWLFFWIIVLGVIYLCMSGNLCYQKLRRKHGFFGHNNGEDDLMIEHNYSHPVPVYISDTSSEKYINVRDKNLLQIQIDK